MLPFYPWEPDKGPFSGTSIDTVLNMNPLANGWGPMPNLEAIGNALGATCLGAWPVRASDGTYKLFAGTETALFLYNTSTQNWDDISGASGPYNVREGDIWQALQFGDLFILVNVEDPPQSIDVNSGLVFADLAGSPPQARYIWAAGDFVVLGYLKVGSDEYPQDIHWSGLNDATYWTIDRKKGSDRQTLPDGDEIMGGFGFPGGARIIQRRAKRAMYFTGGQFIFDIKVIDATRGTCAPLSIVPISADDYVLLREDGWYRGDANTPIGAQRVDAYFLGDVDLDSLDLVQGVSDPYNKTVLYRYTSSAGVSKVIGYDWQLDQWFMSNVALTIMVSSITPGLTLEAADGFPDDVDTPGAPSLDSRIYKGGRPVVGGFGEDGVFYVFGGVAMAAVIETQTIELTPDEYAFVTGCKVKGDPGSDTTMQVLTGVLPDDTMTVSSAVSRSSRTGLYPMRASGMYHRFRLNTAAGDMSFTHIHGLSVQATGGGEA